MVFLSQAIDIKFFKFFNTKFIIAFQYFLFCLYYCMYSLFPLLFLYWTLILENLHIYLIYNNYWQPNFNFTDQVKKKFLNLNYKS